MNAPDKIFVPTRFMLVDGLRVRESDTDEEYIRKDALLEWLKMAVECYSHSDSVNVVDTIRCEGMKWAFQDVIHKIETL